MQPGSVDIYEYLHESRKILNLLKKYFLKITALTASLSASHIKLFYAT